MPLVDKGSRPEVEIERTALHRALSLIGLLSLLLSVWFVWSSWGSLPETVYTHFDASGTPNGAGPRLTIILVPAVGLVLWIAIGLVIRRPRTFNYAVRITPENAKAQYGIAIDLLEWTRAETSLLMAYLGWAMVESTIHRASLPGGYLLMAAAMGLMATVVIGMIRSVRAR